MTKFYKLFALVMLIPPLAVAQAKVSIVHGVPGLTVDVFVNGALTLENFTPSTVTDPLELPAGAYQVDIAPAGSGIENAVISGSANIDDGEFYSLVAHLNEGGSPALTAFNLETKSLRKRSRLYVAHVAAAPSVNIRLRPGGFKARLKDLSNGEIVSAKLRARSYKARIIAAESRARVGDSVSLTLAQGATTVVYAIGSIANDSFSLITQVIPFESQQVANLNTLVTLVHGIPSVPVDVFVNSALFIDNFQPESITGQVELAPGLYNVALTAAEGGDPNNPILAAQLSLSGGGDLTVAAHLSSGGNPTLSTFTNNIRNLRRRNVQVVVRHIAAAPAVDVRLKRGANDIGELANVANGQEGEVLVRRGRYNVLIEPAGTNSPVFRARGTSLKGAATNIVYAIGDLNNGSFGLISELR